MSKDNPTTLAPLSEADIAELKALETAATPDPWMIGGECAWVEAIAHGHVATCEEPSDATFIATVRNLLPRLLAEREADKIRLAEATRLLFGPALDENTGWLEAPRDWIEQRDAFLSHSKAT